jgi:membrane-bound lytic murein transglycosylase D
MTALWFITQLPHVVGPTGGSLLTLQTIPTSGRLTLFSSLISFRTGVLSLLFLSLTACSTLERRSVVNPDGSQLSPQEKTVLQEAPATSKDLNDTGSDLADIPVSVNKAVLQWIDYFQGRGRPHMERYLSRSTRYAPIMKEILKKEGLPEDLIYIALIESGFSSTAHSHANAVGYWQFIRGTGKRYNLQIDSYVDERRDFVKATQAAADYFKGLYNLFGVWYLAIASYNVGENRVKGLVMKYHTRDFWQLARENKLPDETINYVPKFLAARLIAKEPEKYGFTDIDYQPPLAFTEVEFNTSIDIRKLAQGMNLDYDDLRDLNPSYKRGVAFEKGGKLKLRVPPGTEALALAAAPAASAGSPRVYVADEDYNYYRVRRGDTIATIARKFNTSQSQIRELNKIGNRSMLSVGRRIRVPAENVAGLTKQKVDVRKPATPVTKSVQLAAATAQVKSPSVSRSPQNQLKTRKVHIVRKGENLIEIARKYRVSPRAIADHNNLRSKSSINVGARLEIP